MGIKLSEALERLATATMRDVEGLSMLMMAVLDKQSSMMLQLRSSAAAADESSSTARQNREDQKATAEKFGKEIESLEAKLEAVSSAVEV
jgi:hypothetical protein